GGKRGSDKSGANGNGLNQGLHGNDLQLDQAVDVRRYVHATDVRIVCPRLSRVNPWNPKALFQFEAKSARFVAEARGRRLPPACYLGITRR
ncbi:MAG TPA: hypothetical protein VJS18_00175, partial [Paraburkholderia sp.]|nr:hypothetical protein [Paraburkholderia sp.]